MSAAAIIEQARALGVTLWVAGDKIKLRGPDAALDRLLPEVREHKPELLAALSLAGLNETSGHWLIIEPPSKAERWFTPAVSRAELASRYPGAVLVPLPDAAPDPAGQRKLTPAELDELAQLIPLLAAHYGCPPEEQAEMRTTAARDASAALESFRATARELGLGRTEREPERFLRADQWLSLGERKAQT